MRVSAFLGETAQEPSCRDQVIGRQNPELDIKLKTRHFWRVLSISVASEGFEPPKSETADLQSDPFGRLGN